jgi:GH15 family glucan-1,4-alpha-glucosidase
VSRGARARNAPDRAYAPIADYALIGDCHSAALVSSHGSVDWCTFPRFDSGSVFGRILDAERGGRCSITTARPARSTRRYLPETMILETILHSGAGEIVVTDAFAMRGDEADSHHQLLRVVECTKGPIDVRIDVQPRFDYGDVRPWIRRLRGGRFVAVGGNDALVFDGDAELRPVSSHDLGSRLRLRTGDRVRLSIRHVAPELVEATDPVTPAAIERRLADTGRWWRRWARSCSALGPYRDGVLRSALVLKTLTYAPTGAIAAAPTTSLPSVVGGGRNWDYRYCWIRDSSYTVRSLADLGHVAEAHAFREFVERAAAGSAEDLRVTYGVAGDRRLPEIELEWLSGYRNSHPVRVGNAAAEQLQLDVYGHVLELAYRWHLRGHSPEDDHWRFLVDVVDTAAEMWDRPDHGIWEIRGSPRQYVHSKVMAWLALDRGIRLARERGGPAPKRRWVAARAACRRAVETRGYDERRGVFVGTFGSTSLDAASLLIPRSGFIEWSDPRMVRTADAVRTNLSRGDLIVRYVDDDGMAGSEGAFLPCAFWLAECLAHQDRRDEARRVFEDAAAAANDLGLFSEQVDPKTGTALGNFPQGLTHLSHISAAMALSGDAWGSRAEATS